MLIKYDFFNGGVSEDFWNLCEAYMVYGADILTETGVFSTNRENTPRMNLAMRPAPDVVWPTGMDIESRTAPDGTSAGAKSSVPSWFRSVLEDD